jgi:CHAD domain-containing protein
MAKALPLFATDPGGSLAENAPLMLHTRLAEMYHWAPFIADPVRVDELHAMRIASKRLRYTMEIFAPVFQGKERAKEFDTLYDKVKSIQEQIGEIHDADVRAPLLQEFLDRHGDSRPEIRIGLETLITAQHDARARHYREFIAFWVKLQRQGFKRRFLQMLAMESASTDEETVPANEENNAH